MRRNIILNAENGDFTFDLELHNLLYKKKLKGGKLRKSLFGHWVRGSLDYWYTYTHYL
jgi:hypothetical protein